MMTDQQQQRQQVQGIGESRLVAVSFADQHFLLLEAAAEEAKLRE